jgi:hypothetical protein
LLNKLIDSGTSVIPEDAASGMKVDVNIADIEPLVVDHEGENPDDPDNPDDPVNPDDPDNPDNPDNPTPDEHATPVEPTESDETSEREEEE